MATCSSVPYVEGVISGARDNIGAVGRPGQSQYEPVVVANGEESPYGL